MLISDLKNITDAAETNDKLLLKGAGGFVDIKQLLIELFAANCRPSVRWARTMCAEKVFPSVRLGRRVFFDVEQVRASLAQRYTIKSRQ